MIPARDALAAMERLPLRPLSELLAPGPLLILAPHPDDESLGCGGLIAAAVQSGSPPFVLITSDGTGSHPNSRAYPPRRLRATREREALDAVTLLGLSADRLGFLGLMDTQSPVEGAAFDAAVTAVAALAMRIGAVTLLATWAHDPHCDHESAHLIAAAAAHEAGLVHLSYPVWGWTLPPDQMLASPVPDGFRLDITAQLPRKRAAIAAHRSQYAGLITDDPSGFVLPPGLLSVFDRPYETFLSQSGVTPRR